MKKLFIILTVNIKAINIFFSQGTVINTNGTPADTPAITDLNSIGIYL